VKNLEHNDHLGGFTKALKRISDLHVYAIAVVKKKPALTIALAAIVVVSGYLLYRALKK